MRNLHNIIGAEFGWESVAILKKWEQLEKKIANYKNHIRFTLRCLSQKIISNSLKLKSNIKTTEGKLIIYRAEKQLANECVRVINNTIDTCTCLRETCMEDLKSQISDFYFQECKQFIERVREQRKHTVLKRHLTKYEQLCQRLRLRGDCSNNISGCSKTHHQYTDNLTVPANTTDITSIPSTGTSQTTTATTSGYVSKWVRNLLGTPLTEAQVSLLAHGPNFAVAPRHPPYGEHITMDEQAY